MWQVMQTMRSIVTSTYRALFVKRRFYKFNKLIFNLSLRGLGVLNFENDKLSGEDHFLCDFSKSARQLLVLDVGASVGNYSNRVRELSPDATIYAFEPHPKSFAQLQHEASKYGYTALNLACGRMTGRAKLYDYEGNREGSQHASLHKDVIETIHESRAIAWDIQVTTLDHFMEEEGIRKVHLLKIDTEGNELNVLLGAKKSIEKGIIDVIHFEFNQMNVISRVFFKDFYDVLPRYTFYRMLPDGLVPLGTYSPLSCEVFAYQNIVAIRKGCRFIKGI